MKPAAGALTTPTTRCGANCVLTTGRTMCSGWSKTCAPSVWRRWPASPRGSRRALCPRKGEAPRCETVRRRSGPSACCTEWPTCNCVRSDKTCDRFTSVFSKPAACTGWGGKGACRQASALRCSGRRCASTALRCSGSRPVAQLTALTSFAAFKQAATSQMTTRAAREAMSLPLLGAPEAHSSLPARAFADTVFVVVEKHRYCPRGRRHPAGAMSMATRNEHRRAVGAKRRPPRPEPPPGAAAATRRSRQATELLPRPQHTGRSSAFLSDRKRDGMKHHQHRRPRWNLSDTSQRVALTAPPHRAHYA